MHLIQSSRTRIRNSQFLLFTVDRNRTVLRRSKPNSRTTLIGEQPNPWNLLQLQDVMSRHRGAKRPRRYGLSGIISLLSLAYLLSVEQQTLRTGLLDHYNRLSSLFGTSTSQSSMLITITLDIIEHHRAYLCTPSLLFRRRPPQPNYPIYDVFKTMDS